MHLDTPSLFKSKHTLKFIRRYRKSNVKKNGKEVQENIKLLALQTKEKSLKNITVTCVVQDQRDTNTRTTMKKKEYPSLVCRRKMQFPFNAFCLALLS